MNPSTLNFVPNTKTTFTCGNILSNVPSGITTFLTISLKKGPRKALRRGSEKKTTAAGFISHLLILEICFAWYVIRITHYAASFVLDSSHLLCHKLLHSSRGGRKTSSRAHTSRRKFLPLFLFYSIFLAIKEITRACISWWEVYHFIFLFNYFMLFSAENKNNTKTFRMFFAACFFVLSCREFIWWRLAEK